MDPNSMPKSSKSITTNYSAKGRANHGHLFLQGSKFNFERRTPYCCSKTGLARFGNEAVSANSLQAHEQIDQGRFRRRLPRNGEHVKMKLS